MWLVFCGSRLASCVFNNETEIDLIHLLTMMGSLKPRSLLAALIQPRHTQIRHYTMPAAVLEASSAIQGSVSKPLALTTTTEGLQRIADKHITKGIGRMRDHIFKEGRGLEVLTTVSTN